MKKLKLEEVKKLKNKKYDFLVLQGCGGNLEEWVDGITNILKENGIVNDSFSLKKMEQLM